MDRTQTFGMVAIMALLSGALFRTPAVEPARTELSAQKASKPQPAPARNSAEDHVDALDLLADSLGVDISPDGLKRRMQRAMRALKRPAVERDKKDENDEKDLASDVRFLWAILQATPVGTDDVEAAKSSLRAFAGEHRIVLSPRADPGAEPSPVETAGKFLEDYFDRRAAAPADAFDRLDTARLRRDVLLLAAQDHGIRVRFLIATLPDPVDSYTGWQFDPMLDAISQAVSASDYTLDRFYLPDAGGESAGDQHQAARGHAHEDQPGFVIFRKYSHDERTPHVGEPRPEGQHHTGTNERLVLQLVYETPTAGVHVRALARAVRLAARWNEAAPEADPCGAADQPKLSCVRILGPTFSGTVESMARAIDTAKNALGKQHVWIVSGSATDPSNGRTLRAVRGTKLRYQVTVQPDDVLVRALLQHMARIDWSGGIAVLFEGNTQYGRQIRERVREENRRGPATEAIFPKVLDVPFPMNISRLRRDARADQPAIDRALGMPSKFRPLSMEQNGTPSDQIPALFPATAASYLEIQMSEMLQSLTRERIRTAALMATDPRDKLYLAQQISRHAPNLSIVIAESDSLYGHPDYATYLQGALVASTYPLHVGNQQWSAGFDGDLERRQFANGSSQGLYNAALALLNYTQNGEPVEAGGRAPPLVEYGPPRGTEGACADSCAPPVWISVVGRNGLWPVRPYVAAKASDTSVFEARLPPRSEAQRARLTIPSPLFIVLCLVLPFVTGLGWFWLRRDLRHAALPLVVTNPDARLNTLWGLAGIAMTAAFIAALSVARFRLERTVASGGAVVLAAATLLAAADIGRRILKSRNDAVTRPETGRPVDQMAVWRWTLAAAMVWGVANLAVYAWSNATAPPEDLVGYLTRTIDLESGVSPLLPVALLSAGLLLWAATEVRRARTPDAALTDPNVRELIELSIRGGVDRSSRQWTYFNGPVAWAPPAFRVAALFAVGVTCVAFDPVIRPLVSVDGPRFGQFITTILIVLQVLTCLSLAQFAYLWWALKQLLDRMASQPWVDAYQRVPAELFPPAAFPGVPRLIDLQRLVTRAQEDMAAAGPPASIGGPLPIEYHELDRIHEAEMRTAPDTFWSETRTWFALVATIARSCRAPEVAATGSWGAAAALHSVTENQQEASSSRANDLFAVAMAFVIRDALARLWHNLIFITGSATLIFCSHALYPFQPQRQLAAIGWTYIAILFTAVVVVLVQMRRNPVISRLVSATPADRRTWDSALVLKLALFGLIPLLTLFAAQFPDLGAVVLRWVEPVQKALP